MKTELPKTISKLFIYACMGFGSSQPDENSVKLVEECSKLVLEAAEPRLVYKEFHIEEVENLLLGNDLPRHLAGCDKCVFMAVTLGMSVDRLIRRYEITDMAKAVALDACASSLVEDLCDEFSGRLAEQYQGAGGAASDCGQSDCGQSDTDEPDTEQPEGELGNCGQFEAELCDCRYALTARFSPGYGDLPLSFQKVFEHLLDMHRQIGLAHSREYLLTPRKSVTAVIGLRKAESLAADLRADCSERQQSDITEADKADRADKGEMAKACEICEHFEGCTFRLNGASCGKNK